MCRIVLMNARLPRDIEQPDDIGICFCHIHRLGVLGCHEAAFVPVWPVVAVGLAIEVETYDLSAVGHDIYLFSFDGRRRTKARPWPVPIEHGYAFGNDKLPAEAAVFFVQAQQHAPVTLVPGISRALVVCTYQHLAAGHDRRSVAFRAQGNHPLDVPACGRVETIGQTGFRRDHVSGIFLAPLKMVAGRNGRDD